MAMNVVDCEIKGAEVESVEVVLDPGEIVKMDLRRLGVRFPVGGSLGTRLGGDDE